MQRGRGRLRGGGGGTGTDSDAAAWAAAVATNSGTVSASTLTAVSTFCKTLKANGVWTKINRVNVFAGDQLAAALVPLKAGLGSAIETNTNFVSGDYALATGLTGNGTSKKLDTGVSILALTKSDFGMGTWTRTNTSEAVRRADIGSSYAAGGSTNRFYNHTAFNGASGGEAGMGALSTSIAGWSGVTGLLAQETTGTTTQNVFANGVNVSSLGTWNNDGFQAGTVTVFNGGGSFFSNHALSGYYIGNNLDQAALTSAWSTLNTTLGR